MDEETPLYRQIHPSWIQQDRVTSQAFRPSPKDADLLSVYDGDQISAVAAWEHYTRVLGHLSVGVLAVTVGECKSIELTARPDPEPFPEHAIIDFRGYSNREKEKRAKILRNFAEQRGWCYRNE